MCNTYIHMNRNVMEKYVPYSSHGLMVNVQLASAQNTVNTQVNLNLNKLNLRNVSEKLHTVALAWVKFMCINSSS